MWSKVALPSVPRPQGIPSRNRVVLLPLYRIIRTNVRIPPAGQSSRMLVTCLVTDRRATAARCGPSPNAWNRGYPSGRTAHSTRRGAPPPRQVLRPPSYHPVWAAVDPWTSSDRTHGRTPPPTVARIHVHARSKSCTTGLQAHLRPPAFYLPASNCTPATTHPPAPGNIRAAEAAHTKRAPPAVIGRKRPRFLTNRQPAILRRRPANTHQSGMHRIEIISHHTQHLRGAQAE